jgi:hypothetical protein
MLPEVDIWRSAAAMIKRYGAEAGLQAAKRADELLADGDPEGSATWHRIMSAIERLLAERPKGAKVN